MILGLLPVFSGASSIMYYVGSLKFRDHHFHEDFTRALITFFILAIVGSKCSAFIVDYIGRVTTIKISAWCCILALICSYSLDFISFNFSMHEIDWVLMCSLAAVIFSANLGLTSVWSTVALEVPNDEVCIYFCYEIKVINNKNFSKEWTHSASAMDCLSLWKWWLPVSSHSSSKLFISTDSSPSAWLWQSRI